MKNSLITYLLGFFFLISCFKANSAVYSSTDSSLCLEIEGIIPNANEGKDGICKVELLCANQVVESLILKDGKKKFKFLLKKNLTYTIRISKKDFINKLVCIDTKMKKGYYELYTFSFETKMLEESSMNKLDRDYLDFPVALIYFDTRKDLFVHDKEYSSKLKKEIASN